MTKQGSDRFEQMMDSFRPMDATEALARARALVQTEPNLRAVGEDNQIPPETLKWIGQLVALVDGMKLTKESAELSMADRLLIQSRGSQGATQIRSVLYKVVARAEQAAPAAAQGAFIAAGDQVDAFGAVAKIIGAATGQILIIDPYLDSTIVTDFLGAVAEGVQVNLLSDEALVKDTLIPAAERWKSQYEGERPIEVRFATKRTLHDRLIILDEHEVWSLTQSIKDFAKRSHAAALRADGETGSMKVSAYKDVWDSARQVV